MVKAYSIPMEAPRDLVEAYFEVKERALERIMNCIIYSKNGKAHLSFKAGERRGLLRDDLLRNWRYSKHYVTSTRP